MILGRWFPHPSKMNESRLSHSNGGDWEKCSSEVWYETKSLCHRQAYIPAIHQFSQLERHGTKRWPPLWLQTPTYLKNVYLYFNNYQSTLLTLLTSLHAIEMDGTLFSIEVSRVSAFCFFDDYLVRDQSWSWVHKVWTIQKFEFGGDTEPREVGYSVLGILRYYRMLCGMLWFSVYGVWSQKRSRRRIKMYTIY